MFILIYFLVVALSQYFVNTILHISNENEDSYMFDKKSSIILFILFAVGILLQVLCGIVPFLSNFFWYICLLYFFTIITIMFVFMSYKKIKIEKLHEEMTQIYEILQKLVDKKGTGLDFNNVPFKLEYKYNAINKIQVQVDPTSFDEKICTILLQQLNAFLPTFTWSYELHLEERYMYFIGNDKPPTMARWPGSWLRHFRYMPVGITGKGEIAWQPDSVPKNKMGHSQYKDEHGNYIPTDTSLPLQPQGLTCGAPLSLDTPIPTTQGYKTMLNIDIGDYVFNRKGEPEKVIAKSKIRMADKMYELSFKYKEKIVKVKADEIHRFPKIDNNYIIHTKTKELKRGDKIVGTKNSLWELINKKEVRKELVKCILVDDEEHIFAFGEGLEFNDNRLTSIACASSNTGGGKSVYVKQEIFD